MSTEHKMILVGLAEYYGITLTDNQIKMYAEDLADLPTSFLIEAANRYRRDPANTRFPLPVQLRNAIEPAVPPKMVARELADKIVAAIIKRGYTWTMNGGFRPHATFKDAVLADLGELAWAVIDRGGGWQILHDSYYDTDPGTFKAQLRDRIEATLVMAQAGALHQRPRLPHHDRLILPDRTEGPKQIMAGEGLLPLRKDKPSGL